MAMQTFKYYWTGQGAGLKVTEVSSNSKYSTAMTVRRVPGPSVGMPAVSGSVYRPGSGTTPASVCPRVPARAHPALQRYLATTLHGVTGRAANKPSAKFSQLLGPSPG